MDFAVVDIEATNGKPGTERMIEIYILRFDGVNVVDQFGALINPSKPIDHFVQKLTGITDKMVKRAPHFHEVAKRVVEITENCLITGHGVSFDYRILRQEFAALGYQYERKTLDTMTLSQKLIPDAETHGLKNLTKHLGIPFREVHRAEEDTRATLAILKVLLEKDRDKYILQKRELNSFAQNRTQAIESLLEKIPGDQGIIYFRNPLSEVLLQTAASNMNRSARALMLGKSNTSIQLQDEIRDIHAEPTGSYLLALIRNAAELRQRKSGIGVPRQSLPFGLTIPKNKPDSLKVVAANTSTDFPFLQFSNRAKALYVKNQLTEQFSQHRQQWKKQLTQLHRLPSKNCVVLDKGRSLSEKSFIVVLEGKIAGYGHLDYNNQFLNVEILENLMTPVKETRDMRTLFNTHIVLNKTLQIHPLPETDKAQSSANNSVK
ncbi:MAG: 3'-5' exonuclease [Weeksellaceae bacterium]|nr:3'-5' exonuclease [Weeksellaceae bacterium]